MADVASSNVQPGLGEGEFRVAIRSLLAVMPIATTFLDSLDDMTLTRADAQPYLTRVTSGRFSVNELWIAFVNWMAYFFPDRVIKQEIAEVALRRATVLESSW